jgi:hypothetical protein
MNGERPSWSPHIPPCGDAGWRGRDTMSPRAGDLAQGAASTERLAAS